MLEQRWNNICDIAASKEEEMKTVREQLEAHHADFTRLSSWLDMQENRLNAMQVTHSCHGNT